MALRVRTPLLFAALAGVVVALRLSGAAEARVLLTLDDFGAVGDGIANDTQALVDAWKAACGTDDNTYLNVPAGKSYQIWPVTLAGPCRDEIKLLISGNIVAPESPDEWRGGDRGKWLHFSGVSDLALSGGGIIDGRGQQWWARAENSTSGQEAAATAPKALHFEDCEDVTVNGITLQNSQREHLVFTRCSSVEANYLRVTSPEHSPGTVGVLLVSSTNVHIMDDLFSVGGDCVSIVGNCTDVRLRAISCGPGHGISIGGLGENGSLHKVEKIKTDTMFISNTKYGVRVKTYEGGCGTARKVKFAQIVMRNVSNPIIIDQHYSASNRGTPCGTPNASAVAVGEIDYIDITGTSATERAVTFACSDAMPCSRLSLTGVNLTRVGGGNASAYCHQAFGRNVGDVVPASCLGKEDFVRLQGDTEGDADW
ncbi:hypothetical protein ACQ4PT_015354 [Festuca glaucescens]